jgi:hypothetical protein
MTTFKTFLQEADKPDLLSIADQAIAFLKNTPEGRRVHSGDIDEAKMNGKAAEAGMRYWGSWENPSDAEDDEDYDWQQLTEFAVMRMHVYMKELNKKFPGVKIKYHSGEKNWIYVTAE